MFNPDLWLHMPEHTLAALAGSLTVMFNSKRSLKKVSELQVKSQAQKKLSTSSFPPTLPSHSEQSSLNILPCPIPPPIPQFQDIHQTKHILHIPELQG